MAAEVAFFTTQNPPGPQTLHHPQQGLGRPGQMAMKEAGVDEIEASKSSRGIGNLDDTIVNVLNVLGSSFCAHDFQLVSIHVESHHSTRNAHTPRQLASNLTTATSNIKARRSEEHT